MPLFNNLPAPIALIPEGALSAGSAVAVAAGSAYCMGVLLEAPLTLAQMRAFLGGTPTGNIDMGVYDSQGTNGLPLNLLGHTGAIVAATGMFTQNLTANLPLGPGVYWLAFLDTVADSVWCRGLGITGMGPVVKTTATGLTVLPASLGATANTNLLLMVEGLRLGGWS